MNKLLATASILSAVLAGGVVAHAADVAVAPAYPEPPVVYQETGPSDGIRIGYLDCGIAGGVVLIALVFVYKSPAIAVDRLG